MEYWDLYDYKGNKKDKIALRGTKLNNDEFKKDLPSTHEKFDLDESTVNLELEKYNKLLNSDNMKLVMKKD